MITLGVVTAALATAPAALAAPPTLQCSGTYTGGTYGNVNVPPNAQCNINDATILGNVTVDPSPGDGGASLTLGDYTDQGTVRGNVTVGANDSFFENPNWVVDGNVALNSANTVYIYDSTTHGFLSEGTADVYFDNATVDGSLAADRTTDFGEIDDSVIHGDVSVSRTTGGSGFYIQGFGPPQEIDGSLYVTANQAPTFIGGNHIEQNLVCVGNNPPPAGNGETNQVDGREVGQCAGLPLGDGS